MRDKQATTNEKGQLAELKTQLRAYELGYIACKPLINARYDMVLDDRKGRLIRVQIKYCNGECSHSRGASRLELTYQNRKKESFAYQA